MSYSFLDNLIVQYIDFEIFEISRPGDDFFWPIIYLSKAGPRPQIPVSSDLFLYVNLVTNELWCLQVVVGRPGLPIPMSPLVATILDRNGAKCLT
jgi:hypothetical protein